MQNKKSFRLILSPSKDAFMNMATDEAMLLECANNRAPFTLRFYTWKPAAVSIGFFQPIREEVDLEKARRAGVDVVRRYTGGGAVFHDSELTYSIVLSESMVPGSIISSYRQICSGIVMGLSLLGVKSRFSPINDITAAGGKISGNAQTRKQGLVLQHGTILISLNAKRMFSILRVPEEKMRDKLIKNVEERVTCLERELGRKVNVEEVQSAIAQGFSRALNMRLVPGKLSVEEQKLAEKLAAEKYKSRKWNFMR